MQYFIKCIVTNQEKFFLLNYFSELFKRGQAPFVNSKKSRNIISVLRFVNFESGESLDCCVKKAPSFYEEASC